MTSGHSPFAFWLFLLLLAGSVAGQSPARLVRDFNQSPGEFAAAIDGLVSVEHGVVFVQDSIDAGRELWVSDGTPRGSHLLKDILPGSEGSYPDHAVKVGNKVAFRVFDESSGDDVWLTDGSEDGTIKLVDSAPEQAGEGEIRPRAGTPGGLFYEVRLWDSEDPASLWFASESGAGGVELNPYDATGSVRERFTGAYGFVSDGAYCYFLANESELWRSDGTTGGTTRLADLGPAIGKGWPESLSIAAGRVLIHWYVGWGDAQLWACTPDGTDLARIEPAPGIVWTEIRGVVGLGNRLLFHVWDQSNVSHLWASDGTTAGTIEIPVGDEGDVEFRIGFELIEWSGAIYFAAGSGNSGGLWRTDGTIEGTMRVKPLSSAFGVLPALHLVAAKDCLYFQISGAEGWELWRTGGTTANSRRVSRLLDFYPYGEGALAAMWKEQLLFAADRGTTANALWKTRAKGTGVMRLTRPEKSTGSAFIRPSSYLPGTLYETLGDKLLILTREYYGTGCELWKTPVKGGAAVAIWKSSAAFGSDGSVMFRQKMGSSAVFSVSGTDVRQVWVTDGTRRGTRLLTEHPGGYFWKFAMAGGTLYYQVIAGSDPQAAGLWKTDGTPQGTSRVVAANGAPVMPDYDEMVEFNGALYFVAVASDGKKSLWKSDGTAPGSVMVKDWWSEYGENDPGGLAVIGNRLSITLTLPVTHVLWTSDGTAEGTRVVQDGYDENTLDVIDYSHDLGGLQVFVGRGRTIYHPIEWWRSDGTDPGTYPVLPDISHQHLYSAAGPTGLSVVAGAKIFYNGLELVEDDLESELWVTDGTAGGTRKLKDIRPGPKGSNPFEFVAAGGRVYFVADDPEHGLEIWTSDGTEEGTRLLADVEPGQRSSFPADLKVLDGKLYFHALRNATGRELYVVDLPPDP